MHLGTLVLMSLRGNVHVWLGCTKMQGPGIGMVLNRQPPYVHIFGTDPSLVLSHAKSCSTVKVKPFCFVKKDLFH